MFITLEYDFSFKVMIPALIRLYSLQLIEKEMKNDFIIPRAKLVLYRSIIVLVLVGAVASQERSLISKQREREDV